MVTQSSVKSDSSALVAFAKHVRDRLADTLEQTQYQLLYDDLKNRLSRLDVDRHAITEHMSQADQEEVLVNVDIARNWQIKLLERINSLTVHQQASTTMPKKSCKITRNQTQLSLGIMMNGNLSGAPSIIT